MFNHFKFRFVKLKHAPRAAASPHARHRCAQLQLSYAKAALFIPFVLVPSLSKPPHPAVTPTPNPIPVLNLSFNFEGGFAPSADFSHSP